MDFLEFEDEPGPSNHRTRYTLCRAGFGLIGFGLALLGLDSACWLLIILTQSPALWNLVHEPWWPWAIGAPITWATLIGSYLLWGRWSDTRWQRLSGLLVMFNMIHVALWALDMSGELGLRPGKVGHEWFRHQVAEALNWVEYALIAGLAVDVLEHLGASEA